MKLRLFFIVMILAVLMMPACGSSINWEKVGSTALDLRDAACSVWSEDVSELPGSIQELIGCGDGMEADTVVTSALVSGQPETAACRANRLMLENDIPTDRERFEAEYRERCNDQGGTRRR